MEKIVKKDNVVKIAIFYIIILICVPTEFLLKILVSVGLTALIAAVVWAIVFFKRLYKVKLRYEKMSRKAEREYDKFKSAKEEYEDFSDIFSKLEVEKCDSTLHLALGLFDLTSTNEISKEYLKKKYRELIKTAHPDAGGCELFAQKINDAYALLNSFV